MTEMFPEREQGFESERLAGLNALVRYYLDPEDQEFIDDMGDEGDRIGYVYGKLLENGLEDPDELLKDYGVTQ